MSNVTGRVMLWLLCWLSAAQAGEYRDSAGRFAFKFESYWTILAEDGQTVEVECSGPHCPEKPYCVFAAIRSDGMPEALKEMISRLEDGTETKRDAEKLSVHGVQASVIEPFTRLRVGQAEGYVAEFRLAKDPPSRSRVVKLFRSKTFVQGACDANEVGWEKFSRPEVDRLLSTIVLLN